MSKSQLARSMRVQRGGHTIGDFDVDKRYIKRRAEASGQWNCIENSTASKRRTTHGCTRFQKRLYKALCRTWTTPSGASSNAGGSKKKGSLRVSSVTPDSSPRRRGWAVSDLPGQSTFARMQ